MNKFNAQLFGKSYPPLYSSSDVMTDIEEITKIDEQINELAIKREAYVEDLKKKVKKMADTKDKD